MLLNNMIDARIVPIIASAVFIISSPIDSTYQKRFENKSTYTGKKNHLTAVKTDGMVHRRRNEVPDGPFAVSPG